MPILNSSPRKCSGEIHTNVPQSGREIYTNGLQNSPPRRPRGQKGFDMANFYIAVTVCQNKNENVFEPDEKKAPEPGYYAFAFPVGEQDNIKSRLENVGGLMCANICATKKRASELVKLWNDSYKANGTYLFDASF